MLGQYWIMLIAVISVMALANTDSVTAQGQNVTNETGIGENQSISGRISGLAEDYKWPNTGR